MRAEDGSASLEFITAGMLLLLPMVYLVLVMSAVQAGALAVEGAARQAARVFVQGDTVAQATAQAERAIQFALADYGIEAADATVSVNCSPSPADCLTRLGTVTVDVGISVPLPLVPPGLTVDVPLAVPLEATATQQVSRFWSGR
jgi:Flp pilus assembly protein TadG